LVNYLQ